MAKRNLGEEMIVAVFAILDRLDERGAKRLHQLVIKKAGMTPVLKPAIWKYPIDGGVGGVGETTLLPFVFAQPLAESISLNFPGGVALTDTWHEHNGFFLILCSCRPMDGGVEGLRSWLIGRGWNVVDSAFCKVELVKQKQKKSKWWGWWGRK